MDEKVNIFIEAIGKPLEGKVQRVIQKVRHLFCNILENV